MKVLHLVFTFENFDGDIGQIVDQIGCREEGSLLKIVREITFMELDFDVLLRNGLFIWTKRKIKLLINLIKRLILKKTLTLF